MIDDYVSDDYYDDNNGISHCGIDEDKQRNIGIFMMK